MQTQYSITQPRVFQHYLGTKGFPGAAEQGSGVIKYDTANPDSFSIQWKAPGWETVIQFKAERVGREHYFHDGAFNWAERPVVVSGFVRNTDSGITTGINEDIQERFNAQTVASILAYLLTSDETDPEALTRNSNMSRFHLGITDRDMGFTYLSMFCGPKNFKKTAAKQAN